MAKYYSKRKSKTRQPAAAVDVVKNEIDAAVQYVGHWQQRELSTLANRPKEATPVCVPIGQDSYIVGRFGIRKYSGLWYSIDTRTEQEQHFNSKKTAVLHALCTLKGRLTMAEEILHYDQQVSKLSNDINIYQHRIDSAVKNKDYWRLDYYSTRQSGAQYKLDDVKKRLQKTIDLAKYFKIWMS